MVGVEDARQVIRWGMRHGLLRAIVQRRARAGDPGARVMVDRTLLDDPYPVYDAMRERGGLIDTGMSLTTAHHDLCTEILRSADFGTAARLPSRVPAPVRLLMKAGGRGSLNAAEPPSMLAVDPPDHTRYRKLVTRAFSAKAVAALRTRTEEIAEELLDGLAVRGGETVDLVAEYASLLPVTVISEMLGAPLEMRQQFLGWGAGAALSIDAAISYREYARSEQAINALHGWTLEHFERIRRNPGDNILSALVTAHDQGQRLTEDELASIAMLLLAAGFETTVNLIGNGAALLMRHPDQLALLQAEPERWPNAVEEVLRYDSPVQRTARAANRDTEVGGQRVGEGQLVVLLLGAANRDPAVFADPHRFDVTRPDADGHIAFSQGIHYCIGAGLARMEGEVGLQALFRRFPGLALAGPARRRQLRVLRGYESLPVTLEPATLGRAVIPA